jgi:hypothetical protein
MASVFYSLTGWVSYGVPIRGRVVETTTLDLLGECEGEVARVELIGERWETTQANVKHNSQRPDIDGLCVLALLGVCENLRRNIAGRST